MHVAVISSYPEKNLIHGVKTVGVGNYTKQIILGVLGVSPKINFTVFSEILSSTESYEEGSVHVIRCWQRNSPLSIFSTFLKATFFKCNLVLIPFEVAMFGGMLPNVVFLFMLMLMRLAGKKVVLVVHQVPSSEGLELFKRGLLITKFFALFKSIFYKYLTSIVAVSVVFEETLKTRLANKSKVEVIPHGILDEHPVPKDEAKTKLGLKPEKKYILYFGYLSPYKGIDVLVEKWLPNESFDLVVAGGGNPNYDNDVTYQKFISDLKKVAASKNILVTGFVPQEKMQLYFSACDLVVFPYRVFMSSSGPLTQAISFDRPVLLSDNLAEYFNSKDMQQGLQECGLTRTDICFNLNDDFISKFAEALTNPSLQEFTTYMKHARNWNIVGKMYSDLFERLYAK